MKEVEDCQIIAHEGCVLVKCPGRDSNPRSFLFRQGSTVLPRAPLVHTCSGDTSSRLSKPLDKRTVFGYNSTIKQKRMRERVNTMATNKAPGKHYRRGITLMDAVKRFDTEEKAEAWFIEQRWPNGVACPHCGERQSGRDCHSQADAVSMQGLPQALLHQDGNAAAQFQSPSEQVGNCLLPLLHALEGCEQHEVAP